MKKTIFLTFIVLVTATVSSTVSFFLFRSFYQPTAVSTDVSTELKPAFTAFESPAEVNTDTPSDVDGSVNIKPTVLPSEDFVETSRRVTNSVVNITSSQGGYRASSGSGVIISRDGYIITNYHVVEGGREFTVTFANRRELRGEVVGTDPTTDLALIKVDTRDLSPVRYGNSDNVQVGQWVLAVGNPFNLASTVTAGIVSAKGRNINIIENNYGIESFIQTDAVVNPGNSGGALVNARGELVGINTAILSETGAYAGYSFAIPSNLVQKVITDLMDFGEVQRALLGVSIRDLNSDAARELGLPSVDGVYVANVTRGGSAEAIGLREGDVITSVNGVETVNTPTLQEQIARFRPGDRIDLTFIRRGRKYVKEDVRLRGITPPTYFERN